MENLTFNNYQDIALKSIFAKAKKLNARDIEEISPNKIAAYVDEDSETYDVVLEFEGINVLDLSCDCLKNTTLCIHKIALLNFLKTKKTTKSTAVKKKKTEVEILLEQLEENKLRLWVSELLRKNKDIEFLFVNEFSQNEIQFTKKEVSAIIDKAIKSVIKNKKNIDATELKRIIETLDAALTPVSKFCKENLILPEMNDLFLYSNSILFEFNQQISINSIKLIRFIEKRYKENNLHIHRIQNKKEWETIVEENIKFLLLDDSMYGKQMETVFHLYESIDTKERKVYFAKILFEVHTLFKDKGINFIKEIKLFFLKVFSENDLFISVYVHFKPIRFENDYNVFLIEKLIEIKKFDLAEKMSIDQIEGNYNEKYNFDYYQLLSQIYTINQDERKLALLQIKFIFLNFSLESYKLIQKYSLVEDFKKFRIKLLSSLKTNFYGDKNAVQSYFEILYFEGKYKNMIDNISEYTSYELIFKYKEELFLYDKLSFLVSLMKIEKNNYFFNENSDTAENREKFVAWTKLNYDGITIKAVLNSRKMYGISKFMKSLEIEN